MKENSSSSVCPAHALCVPNEGAHVQVQITTNRMVFIASYQEQEAHSDLFLKAGPMPLTYLPLETMQRRGRSPGQCLDHRCQRQEKLSPCPHSAWGAEGLS